MSTDQDLIASLFPGHPRGAMPGADRGRRDLLRQRDAEELRQRHQAGGGVVVSLPHMPPELQEAHMRDDVRPPPERLCLPEVV